MYSYTFTVFTPTFNRAYIIRKLYESLRRQSFNDFEWLVIDDGSTDETSELFDSILSDKNFFPIRYFKTENGGKHRAINKALDFANGKYFYIVDSDDFLPDDALEKIRDVFISIDTSAELFAGVAGQKGGISSPLGSTFENGQYLDITYLEKEQYSIHGDKAEVYYTNVLSQYKFPEYKGEKFIPESVVWNAIAEDGYKLRYFNNTVYFCEYLPDGLTMQGDKKYRSIPKGWGLYIYQLIKYGKLKKLKKWETVFDYYSSFNDSLSMREMAKNLHFKTLVFFVRINGMRLFYKLYNR